MNHPYRCSLDYADSILSVFDIGGMLPQRNSIAIKNHLAHGLEQDMQNLWNNQQILENDLRTASEYVWQQMPKGE